MLEVLNRVDQNQRPSPQTTSRTAARRPPPKAVKCLLPVWGLPFIRQFLEFGLPTWLAPGNIPALARRLPCEFVILTSAVDEPFLRSSLQFQHLCRICPTEIHLIDHLITASNYSTTITLAYAEAIRAAGPDMLDTCFLMLVSDYIVADGSFGNALERVMAGASGVLVGNFQVALEDAMPWLRDKVTGNSRALSLDARTLMRWALSHLHPATVANIVNYPLNQNTHTNRLFWRVDGETLLGRFYLMHMLCIRPEVTDFVIGSSCDYSFIPEMCPSDNVEIIGDSDEYLVIEMQPRGHESNFLRPGRLQPKALAKTLAEWTTARHRENALHSVRFHAADVPEQRVAEIEKEVDGFLADVRRALPKKAKPHRNHPYWRGAIASFREATGSRLSLDEWRLVLGLPDPSNSDRWVSEWLVEKIRFFLYGRPPNVRLWHPRWPDHQAVMKRLAGFFEDEQQRLLLISDVPTIFTASLADGGERTIRLQTTPFLKAAADVYEPMLARFDCALVEVYESDLERCDQLIDRIAPLVKPGGKIVLVVYNRRQNDAHDFFTSISFHSPRLLRPAATVASTHFLVASYFRWGVLDNMMAAARLAARRPRIGIPLLAIRGTYLSVACGIANVLSRKHEKATLRPRQIATSLLVELRIDAGAARDSYVYSASHLARQPKRRRIGIADRAGGAVASTTQRRPAATEPQAKTALTAPLEQLLTDQPLPLAATPPPATPSQPVAEVQPPEPTSAVGGGGDPDAENAMSDGTREQQYNRCVELRDEFGLTPLGLMTNQVFYDDPRRLGILLARYKFVAKMLSGKKVVAELGCGDAFGTRVVAQEVEKVVAYDFDPVFVEDIRQRRDSRWPIEAHVHDIIQGVLPQQHDGIYSLDVIEHIDPIDEHAYLANLRGSLTFDGVLIIGTPSLESQEYASPPSKAGHINCKRGAELKVLLQQYFQNVFLFSMNDEVVHTGFYPMAHYLLAICCGKI